jgi:hypothetical protein
MEKKIKKHKIEKHQYSLIDLRGMKRYKEDLRFQTVDCIDIARELAGAIYDIWKNRKKCPNCGGIVPEITVEWEGRQYRFTCYKIVSKKSGKTLLETDYKKLAHYSASPVALQRQREEKAARHPTEK